MRLIDADALKDTFIVNTDKKGYLVADPEVLIDNAPTVERPQGEWISHYDYCEKHGYNPSASIAFWWCERCGQAVEQPTNFCPNCGAEMHKPNCVTCDHFGKCEGCEKGEEE